MQGTFSCITAVHGEFHEFAEGACGFDGAGVYDAACRRDDGVLCRNIFHDAAPEEEGIVPVYGEGGLLGWEGALRFGRIGFLLSFRSDRRRGLSMFPGGSRLSSRVEQGMSLRSEDHGLRARGDHAGGSVFRAEASPRPRS